MVVLWLAAVTAANIVVAHFGPSASVYTAFALIGLTLVVRDRLHDRWRQHRALKMAGLILAGAALAFLVSPSAGRIGVASAVAFGLSESADASVYWLARLRPWLERSNLSNLVGAAVDSLAFPTLAFGGVLWGVTLGQFTAKVAGALLFSLVLVRRRVALA